VSKYCCLKLFPACAQGAPLAFVKSLLAVFPEVQFCPSGGIELSDVPALLALSNVPCVGGSLLCPPELIQAADFVQIRQLAQQACDLAARNTL